MTRSPHPCSRWDPLAASRSADDAPLDVFLSGQLFFDMVFAGLDAAPSPGTEVWTTGMGSLPGGIANLAVATSRLGLRTGLAAGFGDDVYGRFCWQVLAEQEGVDLSRSRVFEGWHSAVTVSMAHDGDRSMVTHGHPLPMPASDLVGTPPPGSRAVIAELVPPSAEEAEHPWWEAARDHGAAVFADVGWDPTGAWDAAVLDRLSSCHAFLPNEVEAMAYTRTGSAAEALSALADRVPLAVVTRGAQGAVAVDATTGETADVPGVAVDAVDPTGAGDVFGASVVLGTLAGWPLADRVAFAALSASLAVQQFGGSLAAPGWGDIADWWAATTAQAAAGRPAAEELARRYGFLADLLPDGPVDAVRRAEATFALASDL
ncbi:PfkB family carbohydrate kinase [Pseudokineococcus lusitanus]|uniref:Sugar/nucleoside kinase (Ribokinase family) n=1 Tax=Pseudokineococcus lusitanus TaxID=763993 RepID=A0A3N1HK09_9ACTN|nr:PfkB family carbohydrate kinase [Pseudokineococcus lusitanus]ROP42795.1 sugar/nucleoside kinase (ribokinase family) [Pseudokineococcus lusitanus]